MHAFVDQSIKLAKDQCKSASTATPTQCKSTLISLQENLCMFSLLIMMGVLIKPHIDSGNIDILA
jgi:hypothetical protein